MKTWRERLMQIITERGLDMKGVSLAAGLSETQVRDWIKRGRDPQVSSLASVAECLGLSLGQLYDGDQTPSRMVPIVGAVAAGEGWAPIDDGDLGEITFDAGPNPVALVVVGDSMLPRYEPGDLLIGRRRTGSEMATLYGRDCIVMTERDERYLKILKPSPLRGSFTLRSRNPAFEDKQNVRLLWAAEVEWVRRLPG